MHSKIKYVNVEEPRTKLSQSKLYAVLRGGSVVTHQVVNANSYSSSQWTFNCPPPSKETFIDREVELSVPVTVDFTGTAPGGQYLLQSGYDAFRCNPLSSIIKTLTVKIGSSQVTIDLNESIHAFECYNNPITNRLGKLSTTPSMIDQSQHYESLTNTNRNPLAFYGDSFEMGRGGFPYTSFTNTNTTAQVQAILTEPLFVSPLLFGQDNEHAFIGLQNFTVNVTLDSGKLDRIWSHANGSGSTITGIQVTFGQPQLLFTYITPQPDFKIPKELFYNQYQVEQQLTEVSGNILPTASTSITSNSMTLNSIPRRMYVFVRKNNNDLTYNDPDCFYGITGITVNWNNQSGLLTTATPQDLYKISVKNGCELSWTQWSGGPTYTYIGGTNTAYGTKGSVLCLEFGSDIGLKPDEAPGVKGQYQLQVKVTCFNPSMTTASKPTLYIVTVSEGVFSIIDGVTESDVGVIEKKDLEQAKDAEFMDYNVMKKMSGGSFFSAIKNIGSKVFDGLKSIAPIAAEVALKSIMKKGSGMSGGAKIGGRKIKKGGALEENMLELDENDNGEEELEMKEEVIEIQSSKQKKLGGQKTLTREELKKRMTAY